MSCFSIGGLVCKKPTDPLDAPPFVIGCITLLKQFHVDNTDRFIALMGQYVRSFVDAMPGYVLDSFQYIFQVHFLG